jgi:hypothetical protein
MIKEGDFVPHLFGPEKKTFKIFIKKFFILNFIYTFVR